MARKVPVGLSFMKIDKPDARVHIMVNGEPCEMWAREKFENHDAGVVRLQGQEGWDEFLAKPCGVRADGAVGGKGCIPEIVRG